MNTMNNAQVIQAIEKFALHNYLEKLINLPMHKVVLFPIFTQTGAPNLSNPVNFLVVDDLEKISALNSGSFLN